MTGQRPEPFVNADSEVYWAATKESRLVLQECADCSHLDLMPRHVWTNKSVSCHVAIVSCHSVSIFLSWPQKTFLLDKPYEWEMT